MAVVPVQLATRTFDCRTPGCAGEAKAAGGRHAYCLRCQIKRGTRRPDGSFIPGRIPTSPGSRSARDRLSTHGPFEAKAMELVAVARELDEALNMRAAANLRIQQAVSGWRATLTELCAIGADGTPRASPPSDGSGTDE